MKFGEGALEAMGRMGLDELAQALPAFPDSIHPVEEAGALGTVTPGMAQDQMGYERDAHLPQLEAPQIESPQMEIGE